MKIICQNLSNFVIELHLSNFVKFGARRTRRAQTAHPLKTAKTRIDGHLINFGANARGQGMFDGGPSGCGFSAAVTSGSGGGPLVTEPVKGRAMLGRAMLRIARLGRATWGGQCLEVKR